MQEIPIAFFKESLSVRVLKLFEGILFFCFDLLFTGMKLSISLEFMREWYDVFNFDIAESEEDARSKVIGISSYFC